MKSIFTILLLSVTAFANIGTIMAINGNAEVKRDAKMIHATNGMDIQEGDEVITKIKTKVQIMLNDDTAITIGPKSSFSFLEYMYDNSKKSRLSMKATRGFFRSVTGKIGKIAPERFKVKTNMATIGVRGTDFSALLRDTNSFYKCHSGEITLSFEDKIKALSAGEQLQLESDGGTIKQKSNNSKTGNAQVSNTSTFESVRIEDISEKTQDIQDIKFNCQ